jgi:uncharacterized tellurite resistance protein B-like protein
MTQASHSLRTCCDCGIKRPANQMKSKSVRAGGATFRSRKSVSLMTFIGSGLGSKKASGAIEGWFFNTSNRRGSAKTYKQVKICSICYLKPDLTGFTLNPFKIIFWCFKLVLQLALSTIRLAVMVLTNPKVYALLWASICSFLGLTAIGGKKALGLAQERLVLRRVKTLSDEDVLKEAFSSSEFSEISNYVMMNRVATVDGSFSKDEKRYIASSLEIDSEAMALGNRVLADQKLSDVYIGLIGSKDGVDRAFTKGLITNLFALARVDGSVDDSELQILTVFAEKLGLTKSDFDSLKEQAKAKTVELGGSFDPREMDAKIVEALAKK